MNFTSEEYQNPSLQSYCQHLILVALWANELKIAWTFVWLRNTRTALNTPSLLSKKNSLPSFTWEPLQTESLPWHWSFWTLSDLNFLEDNRSTVKENLKPTTSLWLLLTTRKPWTASWTSKGELEECQRSWRLCGTVFKTEKRPFSKSETAQMVFFFLSKNPYQASD